MNQESCSNTGFSFRLLWSTELRGSRGIPHGSPGICSLVNSFDSPCRLTHHSPQLSDSVKGLLENLIGSVQGWVESWAIYYIQNTAASEMTGPPPTLLFTPGASK